MLSRKSNIFQTGSFLEYWILNIEYYVACILDEKPMYFNPCCAETLKVRKPCLRFFFHMKTHPKEETFLFIFFRILNFFFDKRLIGTIFLRFFFLSQCAYFFADLYHPPTTFFVTRQTFPIHRLLFYFFSAIHFSPTLTPYTPYQSYQIKVHPLLKNPSIPGTK